MPKIVMYHSQQCPYCHGAQRLFADRGVSIELISVDDDDDQRCAMEAITGRTTVPQIFIGEHHVGGYEDLVELDEQGRLDHLIVAALGAGLPE